MRLRLSFGLSIASLYLVSTYLIHGRCSDLRSFLNGTEFDAANPFLFWLDYPGSPEYEKNKPVWYDKIAVAANTEFATTGGVTVNVNWADQAALHLWADPSFQQGFDNEIRKLNGDVNASLWTGTIDSCGWPLDPPSKLNASVQYKKRTTPFHDDFTRGLNPGNFLIPVGFKGCCDAANFSRNFGIVSDVVNGVKKPVLALYAFNADVDCGEDNAPEACEKIVTSAGGIITADIYASGVYTVIAKAPAAPGLTWAVWTYHYELHVPQDCSDYTCFCGDWSTQGCPSPGCMPKIMYEVDACPASNGCAYTNFCKDPGYSGSLQQACGKNHTSPDPIFAGSASFTDYIQEVNHEIDMEFPANCMNTPNVCNNAAGSCEGDYSTGNFNNYIATDNNGGGPSYANMCTRIKKANGQPFQMAGDGQYHNYTFEWHTGTSSAGGPSTSAYVNFFVDGVYTGTNNAFVPTRAGRLWIFSWPSSPNWNGRPSNWGGGKPGDGKVYSQVTYISSVTVTPFNEPNDIAYPMTIDRPDGCELYIGQKVCHKWTNLTLPASVDPDT